MKTRAKYSPMHKSAIFTKGLGEGLKPNELTRTTAYAKGRGTSLVYPLFRLRPLGQPITLQKRTIYSGSWRTVIAAALGKLFFKSSL